MKHSPATDRLRQAEKLLCDVIHELDAIERLSTSEWRALAKIDDALTDAGSRLRTLLRRREEKAKRGVAS